MRIVRWQAENFKSLVSVAFEPNGHSMQLTGPNGSGKSSAIDAIWAALGGERAIPEKPIRAGADKAKVEVVVGNLKVTRTFSDKGTRLTVTTADGRAKYSTPQAMLDELVGAFTFDPLAFATQKPAEQAATLRRLVGLDFTALDAEAKRVYDERTIINREVKRLEAQATGTPPLAAVPAEPLPEEKSAAELLERHRAAVERNHQRAAAIREREHLREMAKQQRQIFEEAQRRLEDLGRKLHQMETDADIAQDKIGNLPEVDEAPLLAELRAVEAHNAEVRRRRKAHDDAERARQAIAEKRAEVERVRGEGSKLSARLDEIAREKLAKLAAAKFPVPGMSLDGDVVVVGGVPLAQVNTAGQVRVGLAVAAALSPKLRTVFVRNGSLLDSAGRAAVAAWAAEHNMQVIMESVADGDGLAAVIEEGPAVDVGLAATSPPALTLAATAEDV